MLYQKSIILYDLKMPYDKYVRMTLETSKKISSNLYQIILNKYKAKAHDDKILLSLTNKFILKI